MLMPHIRLFNYHILSLLLILFTINLVLMLFINYKDDATITNNYVVYGCLKMKKALFLDRDGIVNIDKAYLYRPEDVEFVEGIFDLLKTAQDSGYEIIIVTNQSGVARGKYSHDDVKALHLWMQEQFAAKSIIIKDFLYCPHHPKYSEPCECRKPAPGMINEAIAKYDINANESIIIGDKQSDMQAGENAGLKLCILLASQYVEGKVPESDYYIETLSEASQYL